jgi:hypothetical protein
MAETLPEKRIHTSNPGPDCALEGLRRTGIMNQPILFLGGTRSQAKYGGQIREPIICG